MQNLGARICIHILLQAVHLAECNEQNYFCYYWYSFQTNLIRESN